MANKIITNAYGETFPREHILQYVDPGWADIITRLIDDLFDLGWDGQLYQIKEKWGALRFYIGSASTEIHDRISQAEIESGTTCERCGELGGISPIRGWYRCLCPTCKETEASVT